MTTKELLDEYGAIYLKTMFCMGNCQDNDANGCKQLKERQQEIIQELEASIRKEVVEDILKMEVELNVDGNIFEVIAPIVIKEYALSKGIILK